MTRPLTPDKSQVIASIREVLGAKGWTEDPVDLAPVLTDPRGRIHGQCLGLARPVSTDEVSRLLSLTSEAGIPVVPQGGNTGRVGGAIPDASGTAIVLSVNRMSRIREIDGSGNSITVEAGCILKSVQEEAAAHDRFFPLSLGAEGSCRIGGNIATNAGGTAVLRYGNMRDLVLGLEVVLPDGRVWNGLNTLRKNNTGYDLKHLFIGSEGTLGIVTAASLKLYPLPRERATALASVSDPDAALALFARATESDAATLSSFELISGTGMDWAVRHVENARFPLARESDWYVLMELSDARAGGEAQDRLEQLLAASFELGLVTDAVVAGSEQQCRALWLLREGVVEGAVREGACTPCDVAVPLSRVPEFIHRAAEAVRAVYPGCRPYPFGHVGDGNIHFNICAPKSDAGDAFRKAEREVKQAVYDIALSLGGTFSAEHGVGSTKRDQLVAYKQPVEIELMRAIKKALDPHGLMNPGKILP